MRYSESAVRIRLGLGFRFRVRFRVRVRVGLGLGLGSVLGLGLGLDSVRGSTISHKMKYLPLEFCGFFRHIARPFYRKFHRLYLRLLVDLVGIITMLKAVVTLLWKH